jgi:hypothetical protein
MLHIADAEDGLFRFVITKEIDEWPDFYTLNKYPEINSIIHVLGEVHSRTIEYLNKLSEPDLIKKIKAPWGRKFLFFGYFGT